MRAILVLLLLTVALPPSVAQGDELPVDPLVISPVDRSTSSGGACPAVTHSRGVSVTGGAAGERAGVEAGQSRISDCEGLRMQDTYVVVTTGSQNELLLVSAVDMSGHACAFVRAAGHQAPFLCVLAPVRQPYVYELLP